MNSIQFNDHSKECIAALNDALQAFLEEVSGEWKAQTKMNQRTDKRGGTSGTKDGWAHHVDVGSLTATVGNPMQNAIWEEFGTGEYALGGNGRKKPWSYFDKKDGQWHTTTGKEPQRAFWRAYLKTRSGIMKRAQKVFGGKIGFG